MFQFFINLFNFLLIYVLETNECFSCIVTVLESSECFSFEPVYVLEASECYHFELIYVGGY